MKTLHILISCSTAFLIIRTHSFLNVHEEVQINVKITIRN